MKNDVNKRIFEVKNYLQLSENQFAAQAGISSGTLHRARNGHDLSEKTLFAIQKAFNVNRDWLISGTGEMFQENTAEVQQSSSKSFSDRTIEAMEKHIETLERNNRSLIATLEKLMQKVEVNFLSGIAELAGIAECNSCNTVRVASNAA